MKLCLSNQITRKIELSLWTGLSNIQFRLIAVVDFSRGLLTVIMTRKLAVALQFLLFVASQVNRSSQHAKMMEPPSRSSMWRLGFPTPKDQVKAGCIFDYFLGEQQFSRFVEFFRQNPWMLLLHVIISGWQSILLRWVWCPAWDVRWEVWHLWRPLGRLS